MPKKPVKKSGSKSKADVKSGKVKVGKMKKAPQKPDVPKNITKAVSIEATQTPGEPVRRIFTADEIFSMWHLKIISLVKTRELLGIEEEPISEKHAVAIKAIGKGGSIGLLHLYQDGSALFVPKAKTDMPVKNFESTGLTFNIEPVSMEIDTPKKISPAIEYEDGDTPDDIPEDEEAEVETPE